MKKSYYIFTFLFIGFAIWAGAQSTTAPNSGSRLSLRAGYDIIPFYKNNTPYIAYKDGVEAGASFDYYWNWLGIGADFDYIQNKPKSTYPSTNLMLGGTALGNFSLTENKITRIFYGLGPSFRFGIKPHSDFELKLRGGLANIKGGRTELTSNVPPPMLLNFHAGYNAKNVPSAKASLQYNHFVSQNIGLFLGAYYMHHFKVPELVDPVYGLSAAYYSFANTQGANIIDMKAGQYTRKDPCNCDISSIGAFAGVVIKFSKRAKKPKCTECCPVCGRIHTPFCCAECGCTVTITARDKFTKELLENTDVALTDASGSIVQTASTNSFGVVVFKNVRTGNYKVKGKLYDTNLEENQIVADEFKDCQVEGKSIQKEILYTDENFIIRGKAVVCNTSTPLKDVSVVLKNTQLGIQKTSNTHANGEFLFQALQNASYTIYGKKEKYLSQTETITTKDYDRNKTLFIKLEICMDNADCGSAIVLKNILYDLDKYFIREDAKPELNRLVQFMKDYPQVRVELSSHTDSRASAAYNITLSQNRADAAVNYIVSQGIKRSRLVGKGYGESRLLNKCADGVPCTEAEHQINRRTEVKVICPD